MRASELAQHLAANVDGVVRLLLPNGKRVGQEWRVGSVDGEPGKSMGVHMTGNKAGVWLDGEPGQRSEEHTSELQSLMRISYAVFCLKKKRNHRGERNLTLDDSHSLPTRDYRADNA